VPLQRWTPLPAAAAAVAADGGAVAGVAGRRFPRRRQLAERLAARNRELGNDVEGPLADWLTGAEVVVSGQQPGLLGGPLLTLVKACAVAATVQELRAAGNPAVGFLWLATGDDDLPEMGWGRVAVDGRLVIAREQQWRRGMALGGAAILGTACHDLLNQVAEVKLGEHGRAAVELARSCYRPGRTLGDATAAFLGQLLAGSGVVLVDACEEEVARSAADAVDAVLGNLPAVWTALADGEATMRSRGFTPVLRVTPARLPVFRRVGDRRERLLSEAGACPVLVRREHAAQPARFLPNAWLRPLVQDAALDTGVAVLGGAELAYHLQTAPAREVLGMARPQWRLRPHLTVATAAERRLAAQLGVSLDDLLHQRLPRRLVARRRLHAQLERLGTLVEGRLGRLAADAAAGLPAARGDVEATRARLRASLAWLDERLAAAAARSAEVVAARWEKLRAFLRPDGEPQERALSVLAPLLRLGPEWPSRLAQVIPVDDPGMAVLFWGEGGAW